MRFIIIFTALALISSCKKNEEACKEVKYDEVFSAHINDQFCLNDYQFEIVGISDEKCPCHLQCIWEGVVRVKISVTNPKNEKFLLNISDQSEVIKNESIDGFAPDLESFTVSGDDCINNPAQDFTLKLVVREE